VTARAGARPILLALVFPLLLACSRASDAPAEGTPPEELTVAFAHFGPEMRELMNQGFARFTRKTGVPVRYIPALDLPQGGRLTQYLEWLGRGATVPDVYQADVIEVGSLAEHMIDLGPSLAQEAKAQIPAIMKAYRVGPRLVAMPLYTDVGLLLYRTDLLAKYGYAQPPATWDELTRMAARIQAGERAAGHRDFWGFSWPGAETEDLLCLALEIQASHGGGSIIEPDGTISVANARSIQALRTARSWVGTISPAGITSYLPEDARELWLAGDAAFLRSWPYAYAMAQARDSRIRGKVAVTALPSGGAGKFGTLGGWQLSVSRFSTRRQAAIEFLREFTSRDEQRRRAITLAALPTASELYDDPEILRANPFFAEVKQVLREGAVVRPTAVAGAAYPRVAAAYTKTVHTVLAGEAETAEALASLEKELVEITGLPARDSR
jgi:trehalose/maltose transport system substrate-binding protein